MTAGELFQAGRLDEAIDAAVLAVKRSVTDLAARSLLCELLCFRGDFDRIDKHLEVIAKQEPTAASGTALFRQLIRAAVARRQVFQEGRMPELLAPPTPQLQSALEAALQIRAGDRRAADALLTRAAESRRPLGGTCNATAFDDFRDFDDLTAAVFEILTSTGKYYWIPMEAVRTLEFRPVRRPRDVLWRAARLQVRGGPDGEVYLACLYPGTDACNDDRLRVGRAAEWAGDEGEPCRGLGLRAFMVGEESKTILDLEELSFHAPEEQPAMAAT